MAEREKRVAELDKRVCPNCESVNACNSNYCEFCGTKISEVCPACWKNNGQPSSCPDVKCGYPS